MKFVDSVKVSFKAGNGGAGYVAFFQDWLQKKPRPDGGNGGNGGNIIIVAKSSLNSLAPLQSVSQLTAQNGEDGNKSQKHGKNGDNLYLEVPVGTVLLDDQRQELIFDFIAPEQSFTIVEGGKGGLGNAFLSAKRWGVSKTRQLGTLGQQKTVYLDLRFVADIGLIGLPNAGKSSLLKAITNSLAKVGPYQFTTISPNLGVMQIDQKTQVTIADLPGIIENAHQNKGLGNQFLKHAQRCRLLVHIVDLSFAYDVVKQNIALINDELVKYHRFFRSIPQIVVGNKVDLIDQTKPLFQLYQQLFPIMISAKLMVNLKALKAMFIDQLQNHSQQLTVAEMEMRSLKKAVKTFTYNIEKNVSFKKLGPNTWELSGQAIIDLLTKFDINSSIGLKAFNVQLKKTQIEQILKREGLQNNDLIYLANTFFYWKD